MIRGAAYQRFEISEFQERRLAMRWLVAMLLVILGAGICRAETVLVEAEGFEDLGGWVVDSQFMDQMGSPFLLAHGLGVPVKAARTTVNIPADGQYKVFVRTRDWVAPFGPGEFALEIDGKALPTAFGKDCGADWTWQAGPTVALKAGRVTLGLTDTTGFEGRCDAIVLSSDAGFVPPNGAAELAAFRKKGLGFPAKPPTVGRFDLVVIGGGIAGTSAAIAGARQGLSVALIQDRPVLGGNSSSEIRVQPEGKLGIGPYPRLGDIVAEIVTKTGGNGSAAENYHDQRKLTAVEAEPNIKIFLNTHANVVEMDGKHILAVVARNVLTNAELRFEGRVFADCTGDGTIGFLAGADYRMGREARSETGEPEAPVTADRLTQGTTNMWYALKQKGKVEFPDCPWGLHFNDDTCYRVTRGDWDWETGMDHDTIKDAEAIRDNNFRAVYGNWSYLKNNLGGFDNWKLQWLAYVAGKRESRRLMGDVILREQDYLENTQFPDACVPTGWALDVHYATPEQEKNFPGQEFRTKVGKAPKVDSLAVPYRCFYSRNVDNLFMAGRNISVTHVALGAVRVQKTTGLMGVVIGRAAMLCKKYEATPRELYQSHLDELKVLWAQPGKRGD
jgi:hypothetical protein